MKPLECESRRGNGELQRNFKPSNDDFVVAAKGGTLVESSFVERIEIGKLKTL